MLILVLIVFFIGTASSFGQVKLPHYSRDVLPNGAVVYLAPRPGLPVAHFRVLIKGGAESEPRNLAGLSSITAELLRRGAGQYSADQFSNELDALGAIFSVRADEQATVIDCEFLKKDLDHSVGLLSDAVLRPAFPE